MQEPYLDAIRLDGDEAGTVSVTQSLEAVLCLHGPKRGVDSSGQDGGGGVKQARKKQQEERRALTCARCS